MGIKDKPRIMTKQEIKIQLNSQFMKDDNAPACLESELDIMKRWNVWLLNKLASEYHGKVIVNDDGSVVMGEGVSNA